MSDNQTDEQFEQDMDELKTMRNHIFEAVQTASNEKAEALQTMLKHINTAREGMLDNG